MLDQQTTKRSTSERLGIVETKVSKLDNIEHKVSEIQINVIKVENKLDSVTNYIEKHLEVDSKRLDRLEDIITQDQVKREQLVKLWTKLVMLIGVIGTVVAIYTNLKGK